MLNNMHYIKKSLNLRELNLFLPKKKLRIIDLGPEDFPYNGRKDFEDEIITIDFDNKLNPTYNYSVKIYFIFHALFLCFIINHYV